jgi:peptidoglycan hydrolase-like protein with peptidoglycan-binding domain
MIITNPLVFNEKKSLDEQVRILQRQLDKLTFALQGRISLGTGVDGSPGQNVQGEFQQFTTSATPDAENTITHTLGSVPIGFIVLWQDKAGSLYQSPTSGTDWTSTSVYLKCEVASLTALIFLLPSGATR